MLLKPGHTCDEAIRLLEDIESLGLNDVRNQIPHLTPLYQGRGNVYPDRLQPGLLDPVLRKYDEWTASAADQLHAVFSDHSVAEPLRGGRYGYIIGGDPAAGRTVQLLNAEVSELSSYLRQLANRLREMKEHYKRYQGLSLILDTNDLLHGENFTKIPWRTLYGKQSVVVLPHVVIDELDKKSYAQSDSVRRRARGVFLRLEGLLDALDESGSATLDDGTPFQVLADIPGHVRQPNCDDEVVARACELQQAVTPDNVLVITLDNGMRVRAKAWSLRARKLDEKYRISDPKTESVASS